MSATVTPPSTPAAAPAPAAAAPAAAASAAKPAAAPAAEPAKPAAAAAPAATPAAAAATPPAAAPAVSQLGDPETDDDAVPALGADAGEEPAAAGDKPAEDKPPVYDFKPAEGAAPFREPVIKAYTEVLTKHKVDPAVASEILQTMLPAIQADSAAQVAEQVAQTKQAWSEELNKRHGAQTREVMRLANRALATGARPEFVSSLRGSALAVNPDFIDLLASFGRLVSNDRSVNRSGPSRADQGTAEERAAREYEREKAAAKARS